MSAVLILTHKIVAENCERETGIARVEQSRPSKIELKPVRVINPTIVRFFYNFMDSKWGCLAPD